MSEGPLAGVRVLAAEQMHALPHATQLLARMGADVLKVEPLGGESARGARPSVPDRDGHETGTTFVRNNLDKSSIAIDLKTDVGRELFLRLAETADVVAENFRPGTADRLRIGYEDVRVAKPDVVYVSVSGFGNTTDPASPYRDWAAYAPIVEGMAGLFEYSRESDGPPRLGVAGALGDTTAGLYAAIGLLAALRERDRTGRGCYVDVSMYDSMIALADVIHVASIGTQPNRIVDGVGILHSFRARDGWFTVQVIREPHFPRFAEAVGHPEWTSDPRLATRAGWSEHVESVIRPGVERWAAGLTRLEASEALARHGVAAGPVNTANDVLADPHVRERGFVHEMPVGAEGARVAVVGNPIAFRREAGPAPPPRPWPTVGEHTQRVLEERLGLTPDEIAALRRNGVVG